MNDSHEYASNTISRRRFLRSSTVAAAATGLTLTGSSEAIAQSQPETIELGGKIDGWQGRKPDAIAGETNPTLSLEPGTDYRVIWTNLDGQGHNFALLDADENVLERTEIMNEKAETQTIEFTARSELAEYVCEPHITSMHGPIEIGDGSASQSATTGSEPDKSEGVASFISEGPIVRAETVVDGRLVAPLDFEVPSNRDDRYYITDRVGQVYVYDGDDLRDEPVIDVSDELVEISGEMGLLGLAFHPEFAENRKFYLRYSAPSRDGTPDDFDHTEVLSEFTANDDGLTADPESERTVLEIPSPYDTHNSGAVAFGPDDGYLYMGMGDGGGGFDVGVGHVADWYERFDGGSGPDVSGNGQDVTENLLGSILRIDIDGRDDEKAYGIPEDNPLVGKDGLNEHYAWGFRNPWRMGFSSGELYASDVGQSLYEEINHIQKGNNYGWNVREGTHCFKPGPEASRHPPDSCPTHTPDDVRGGEALVEPVVEYPHSINDESVGVAAIAGYIYENEALSALRGKYVFGDYRLPGADGSPTGRLLAATPTDDGQWPLEELRIENTDSGRLSGSILAFGRDNTDRLYVLTTTDAAEGDSGAVHRLIPSKAAAQETGTTPATGTSVATDGNETNSNGMSTSTGSDTGVTTNGGTVTDREVTRTGTPSTTESSMETEEISTSNIGGNTTTSSETGSSGETTSSNGPGFGLVAGAVGIAGVAARVLANRK